MLLYECALHATHQVLYLTWVKVTREHLGVGSVPTGPNWPQLEEVTLVLGLPR